ncbi:fumarylacetoacetate hydrolase family protein [Myxococcus qinghaiensis]|uniref:fumarylacetoacetate hydrolase family protein n=1 Tax=Myxococcus qinghaiensis TaxID=2906758 RepID=UPI0020A7BBA8|nr:fumarylacetoacetate hydrolase family protein [Myxococcus qinghaiensis]MCP3166929.1 fumarylacetoacetate hydrolase family protein [Myxococcus qinghaiensis]
MKLATLKDGTRDGRLIVVKRDNSAYALATNVALTLQAALDDWDTKEPLLRALAAQLEAGAVQSRPLEQSALHAPLPRAYEWIDGSAYINHVLLVRKARNAEPPATLKTDPLVYQGGSGEFLAPTADIPLPDEAWGLDFESEVCVILGDTPRGTKAADAEKHVKLLMLANDVSLRNLIPDELAKGFGFFQSKPATAFSPFAVTPDEIGPAWREGRIHLRLRSVLNGVQVGDTDAGPEMHFSFFELIQHLCKTRGYTAGTILGSGTVSNVDRARGISCLAEQRMIETIEEGKPKTPFMKPGDTIDIEMTGEDGQSVFGRISQKVVKTS